MTFDDMATQCRALTKLLPEIGDQLGKLEIRFLGQAVEAQQKCQARPTLDQRRLKVALWPDLSDRLEQSVRRRETGLPIDHVSLLSDVQNLIDAFDNAYAKEGNQRAPGAWHHRLRQTVALSKSHPAALIYAKPWMHKLGERNPLTWDAHRLHRIQRMIARSDRNSDRSLDEIVLADFLAKSLGKYGSLQTFLDYAALCTNAKWQWRCDDGMRSTYRGLIRDGIEDINQVANTLLVILWKHKRIWRAMPVADEAAEAVIDAILACCASIRLLASEPVVFPDENLTFIAMGQAVRRAKDLTDQVYRDADAAFPGLILMKPYVESDAYGVIPTVSIDMRFGRVSLTKRPRFRDYVRYFFQGRPKGDWMYEPLFFREVFQWYRTGPQRG